MTTEYKNLSIYRIKTIYIRFYILQIIKRYTYNLRVSLFIVVDNSVTGFIISSMVVAFHSDDCRVLCLTNPGHLLLYYHWNIKLIQSPSVTSFDSLASFVVGAALLEYNTKQQCCFKTNSISSFYYVFFLMMGTLAVDLTYLTSNLCCIVNFTTHKLFY